MKKLLVSVPALIAANAASAHPVTAPHLHAQDGSAAMWIGLALVCIAAVAALGSRSASFGRITNKDHRK